MTTRGSSSAGKTCRYTPSPWASARAGGEWAEQGEGDRPSRRRTGHEHGDGQRASAAPRRDRDRRRGGRRRPDHARLLRVYLRGEAGRAEGVTACIRSRCSCSSCKGSAARPPTGRVAVQRRGRRHEPDGNRRAIQSCCRLRVSGNQLAATPHSDSGLQGYLSTTGADCPCAASSRASSSGERPCGKRLTNRTLVAKSGAGGISVSSPTSENRPDTTALYGTIVTVSCARTRSAVSCTARSSPCAFRPPRSPSVTATPSGWCAGANRSTLPPTLHPSVASTGPHSQFRFIGLSLSRARLGGERALSSLPHRSPFP